MGKKFRLPKTRKSGRKASAGKALSSLRALSEAFFGTLKACSKISAVGGERKSGGGNSSGSYWEA